MNPNPPRLAAPLRSIMLAGSFMAAVASHAVTIPNTPLSAQKSVKPMVMLVASKDHRLAYEAYNDASDLDSDGAIDVRFKPMITYVGLFNPAYCYSHNNASDNTGLFTPAALASGAERTCSSGRWSGNWLNYVTTSRIDALRVVLYGGLREIDTNTNTVLRRAYIPQDAHSWAKEYTSTAVDGYDIAAYTPLAAPSSGRRHFFGNLTANASTDCATLDTCSNLPPWLSVVENSNKRVWEWASTERPVLADGTHGGTRTNRTVRVSACNTATYAGGCKQYPSGKYKPVGLLHDYGESESLLFGLLTGSYDQHLAGGRLRKVAASFKDEVDASSGTFTAGAPIVRTFDRLRIRDFNNGRTDQAYAGGWVADRPPNAGEFPDWGNPVAEMMYEAVRYFSGKGAETTAFAGTSTRDAAVGLSTATWDDPYSATSAAKAPYCAKPNMMVISDVNVSYDSDQLPGVYSGFGSGIASDLTGLNVQAEADIISANEPDVAGPRFIGQSGPTVDSAPSPKSVASLGNIRGLAPEEPTKQGSYYAASVARYAKRTDLRPDIQGQQSVDSFMVAMASPLPRIEVPMPTGRKITLVPFAKSVDQFGISAAKGAYQPTNQIVDFYVESIANSGAADADPAVNGGRYYAKFRINFEDVEQGADHDMDAIVEYTVWLDAAGQLRVQLTPTYQAGSIRHRMGYVISGTTADGVYLEVQDEGDSTYYFLNTPPTRPPGFCDVPVPAAECNQLPHLGGTVNTTTRSFTAGVTASASLLRDPLWYAAKWGGLIDSNGNDRPDLQSEWDADGDGVPDTYFLVQNPLKLSLALKRTFDEIVERTGSASNLAANSTSISTSSRLFQGVFNTQRWSGDVTAYAATTSGAGSTPQWQASSPGTMPDWNSRAIFMRSSVGATVKLGTADGTWTSLSSIDKGHFGNNSNRFNYIRGRRDHEIKNGGTLRDRAGVLGDIIHSSPAVDLVSGALYVGANDGMLHAFDIATGVEKFAFIPRQSVPRLNNLISPTYVHDYFVDGDIVISPRNTETANKAYLFSLLGRGGKGLFALDVSNPSTFSTSSFLWEYTPLGSTTAASDGDLGFMLGRPVLAKLSTGKLGLIAANGYNSTNGRAVLYVFVLNTDGSIDQIRKIDTGVGGDNGLAGPYAIDADNDGAVDTVFAGDLKGNVWRFDLSSTSPASWGVAHGGSAMFVARDSTGAPQPITASMYAAKDTKSGDPNFGKWFVFFGTGSYFKTGDPGDLQRQSWYGLIVDTSTLAGRSDLVERDLAATGTFGGSASRAFSAATAGDMSGKRGWFVDLDQPHDGERIVTASKIVAFAVPALIGTSMYPIPLDPCAPGGSGYLNLVDPWSGAATSIGILDVNGNNQFNDDKIGDLVIGSVDLGVGIPTEALPMSASGRVIVYVGGSGSTPGGGSLIRHIVGLGAAGMKGRISWREIVRD